MTLQPPNPPTPSSLSDPTLAPFLSPTFSAKSYLNNTIPPLLPPPALSTGNAPTPKPANAEPLSTLSSKATTLLSSLDLHTQRLLSTLQSLTDEILRLTPRLGYEVELLRSDVVTLSTTLITDLAPHIEHFEPPRKGNTPTATTLHDDADADAKAKLDVLSKLEMLSTVRARLEDVIKVFGQAMDWPLASPPPTPVELSHPTDISQTGLALGPSPRTPSPIRALKSSHKKPKTGTNPIEDVLYLLSCEDLVTARAKVGELRELCKVFENTVEGPARNAVVEALEAKIDEEEERKEGERRRLSRELQEDARGGDGDGDGEKRDGEEKSEGTGWAGGRDGYYGLINQLSRMRGNMG